MPLHNVGIAAPELILRGGQPDVLGYDTLRILKVPAICALNGSQPPPDFDAHVVNMSTLDPLREQVEAA